MLTHHGAHHYFHTACGHRHRTPAAAGSCRNRGWDQRTRAQFHVIEVTIRPGRVTRTRTWAPYTS